MGGIEVNGKRIKNTPGGRGAGALSLNQINKYFFHNCSLF